MTREQLEHAIRAACSVAEDDAVVVIGSQSVLGQFPDAPSDVTMSLEVDMYPRAHPERASLLDGALGELSTFHSTHGFYVHGVGPETAVLPAGWQARLVPVQNDNTQQGTGWCLEAHDLTASKLAVPFREQDSDFVAALLWHGMIYGLIARDRLAALPLLGPERDRLIARLDSIAQAVALARQEGRTAPPSFENGTWPSAIPREPSAPVLPPTPPRRSGR
jgi:hypothetical protein